MPLKAKITPKDTYHTQAITNPLISMYNQTTKYTIRCQIIGREEEAGLQMIILTVIVKIIGQ